jgi:site-specific recombinase XerC
MVAATDLLALGIRLMDTWERPSQKSYKATRYRNGLLVALLIACPIRLKNLAGLVIGRHLSFDGSACRLELTAAETKTGRPYHAAVPAELTPYIDRWLQVHRPTLQSTPKAGREAVQSTATADRTAASLCGHLWLHRWGRPMNAKAIQRQIGWYTEQAFGRAIRPHLFRDHAVTELVDVAPEDIGIAPDLLGHADLRTTRKHYIQAHGMTAHVRVQEMIAARRRAAAARGDAGA